MRLAALVLVACAALLPACLPQPTAECGSDVQCGDDVCARTGECLARPSVREVTVRWTVNGAAADAASCTTSDLYIQFDGAEYGDTLRFSPVPCQAGSYVVDRLPKRYVKVELGVVGGTGEVSPIDSAMDRVQLDLFQ